MTRKKKKKKKKTMRRRSLSLCMRVGGDKGYGGKAVIQVERYSEEVGDWFSSKVSQVVESSSREKYD